MKNRFVIRSTSWWNQCPTCEIGSDRALEGFETLEDLKLWVLHQYPDVSVEEVFDVLGEEVYDFYYELGRHSFTGIIFSSQDQRVSRTRDNGSGTLVWEDLD